MILEVNTFSLEKKFGVEDTIFCCPLLQGIFSTQKEIPKPKEKISQTSSAFPVVLGIWGLKI